MSSARQSRATLDAIKSGLTCADVSQVSGANSCRGALRGPDLAGDLLGEQVLHQPGGGVLAVAEVRGQCVAERGRRRKAIAGLEGERAAHDRRAGLRELQ